MPLDAEKFKQAVLNLVINALEAMPEGGSLIAGRLGPRRRAAWSRSPTPGRGSRRRSRPDLFKPYFSTKGRGTGMGLALTEKLVGQHGGRIDFRTGPAGTTFSHRHPPGAGDRGRR